ncbi:MAG: TMEM43 family protein [Bacteroidales bacterium]|nr:TMEM43 family protein [Bacteroidales bacterium]
MAYQVKTTKSYGTRLTDSLKGIVTGVILFAIGTIVLFWNEGNFVKTKKSIREAEKALVVVSDVSRVDPSLNGQLIHAGAFATTDDVLTDETFGVSETAIALRRSVEYYQYVEKKEEKKRDKIGGGEETITTYTYEKKWVSEPVNSANFADPDYYTSNTVLKAIESRITRADNVTFGGYRLPTFMVEEISGDTPVAVNVTSDETTHVNSNVVYYGQSPSSPRIGDVRITLTKVVPANISIIGKVVNNTFEQFHAKNGKTFARVAMGTVSADSMFADAHAENSALAWLLRILGIVVVVIGLKMMFGILPAVFKVLPFLGNIIGAGVGLVCIIGGAAWSMLVISLSWLFYRPLIGIPLLLVAVAGIWFLKKKAKAKHE